MIEIYTDGATSKNGSENAVGGFAYIILNNNEVVYQEAWAVAPATNNQCELWAIIKGCQYVEKNFSSSKVTIYSDSAYCINCYKQKWYKNWIKNGWINSKKQPVKNKDLWELLIPYFENDFFKFEKVKGHSGNLYNEMVDELAVKARLSKELNENSLYQWCPDGGQRFILSVL